MKATLASGDLVPLENCYINIPELNKKIVMNILPDISDTKSASYSDENAIGRSSPFKNFSHSENRTITWNVHFMVCKEGDQDKILGYLRVFEACAYPFSEGSGGAPYAPPPICHLKCGKFLSSKDEICAVLKSYNVKADPSVPWDENSYMPYKLDVDLSFDVVYDQSDLPGAKQIIMEI